MTLSIIYFTEKGEALAKKISEISVSLNNEGINNLTSLYDGRDKENPQSKSEWLEQQMKNKNPIIFIGACGIAVRLIAPFIQSKLTDSPVLVMDEMGHFVIPLLSGHVGGANELADVLAEKMGATAVITTATDIENKFAVDVFAKKSGLSIVNKDGIAKISSKILRDEQVSVYIENEIIEKYSDKSKQALFQVGHFQWNLPKELTWVNAPKKESDLKRKYKSDILDNSENDLNRESKSENIERNEEDNGIKKKADIYIGRMNNDKYDLNLCIKEYVIGIGCRRGKTQDEITEFVTKHCQNMNIDMSQIVAVVSIDVKKDEEGLVGFCGSNRIPFITYPSEILALTKGEFKSSAFVESKVGVDNVCERSVMTYISKWSTNNFGKNESVDRAHDSQLENNDASDNPVIEKQDIEIDMNPHLILGKQAENGMTIAIGRL